MCRTFHNIILQILSDLFGHTRIDQFDASVRSHTETVRIEDADALEENLAAAPAVPGGDPASDGHELASSGQHTPLHRSEHTARSTLKRAMVRTGSFLCLNGSGRAGLGMHDPAGADKNGLRDSKPPIWVETVKR